MTTTTPPEDAPAAPGFPTHAPLAEPAPAREADKPPRVPLTFFTDPSALARFTQDEPAVHDMARALVGRQRAAYAIAIGTGVLSGSVLALGVLPLGCSASVESGSGCPPNLGAVLGAALLSAVGMLVASAVEPGRNDYKAIADAWNATIDVPAVPNAGLDPTSD